MTTTYEETPTFEERVWGTPLIIDGRVEKAIEVRVDDSGDKPQVQTIFRVRVESVLKGQIDEASIHVRVVGGKAEGAETDWSIPMKEGDRVILMLAPDYGPAQAENVFVPYFSTSYPVTAKGQVKLDAETAQELTGHKIQVENERAKLADLRSMINTVMESQKKQADTLAKMEPVELREIPPGEVGEMPHAEPGGATSASPESETETPEEAE